MSSQTSAAPTSTNQSRAKARIANVRGRGRNADLDTKVIWKSVLWQGLTALVFASVAFFSPLASLILLGAFGGVMTGLMIYNAVYWRTARKMWDEKSQSERARLQVQRGRSMKEDFIRSRIVFRTNLICLSAFAAAFVVVLLVF